MILQDLQRIFLHRNSARWFSRQTNTLLFKCCAYSVERHVFLGIHLYIKRESITLSYYLWESFIQFQCLHFQLFLISPVLGSSTWVDRCYSSYIPMESVVGSRYGLISKAIHYCYLSARVWQVDDVFVIIKLLSSIIFCGSCRWRKLCRFNRYRTIWKWIWSGTFDLRTCNYIDHILLKKNCNKFEKVFGRNKPLEVFFRSLCNI